MGRWAGRKYIGISVYDAATARVLRDRRPIAAHGFAEEPNAPPCKIVSADQNTREPACRCSTPIPCKKRSTTLTKRSPSAHWQPRQTRSLCHCSNLPVAAPPAIFDRGGRGDDRLHSYACCCNGSSCLGVLDRAMLWFSFTLLYPAVKGGGES